MRPKENDSKEIIKELGESGAGVYKIIKVSGQYILFPLLNSLISWDKAWDIFDKEGQKILKLVSEVEKEQLFQRVLVPKLFGLEDNSRYYSIAMVIEHLLMVGMALQTRVPLLSRGKKLNKHVKIEDVKPYREIDEDIVEKFEEFLSTYREKLDKNVEDIHIDNTSLHPWFGEFNPKQWSLLAFVHQIVHRRQVEAILKGLK